MPRHAGGRFIDERIPSMVFLWRAATRQASNESDFVPALFMDGPDRAYPMREVILHGFEQKHCTIICWMVRQVRYLFSGYSMGWWDRRSGKPDDFCHTDALASQACVRPKFRYNPCLSGGFLIVR